MQSANSHKLWRARRHERQRHRPFHCVRSLCARKTSLTARSRFEHRVFKSLTVEENRCVGLKVRPRSGLEEAYTIFPRLQERRKNRGSQLSTTRAILGQPAVLLFDETLEGLAPVICDELMASLLKIAEERRMTMPLVEQQVERTRFRRASAYHGAWPGRLGRHISAVARRS